MKYWSRLPQYIKAFLLGTGFLGAAVLFFYVITVIPIAQLIFIVCVSVAAFICIAMAIGYHLLFIFRDNR